MFMYSSVLQAHIQHMCEAYFDHVTFCCQCRLLNMWIYVGLSLKCFQEAVAEAMEDEEIMNCLTKLHDAEVSQREKGLTECMVLTEAPHSTFFNFKC